ncbi:MAG: restriction endonuclease [Verrucomicrobia bacterium]|nr:restriction endonuclease [Verrucomicrobiota bacterium]
MSLSLKESRAATEMAKVLYTFLPGSGSVGWKGHVTFATVAQNAGIGNFWTAGSKEPAIARLLELTLEKRRDCFEPLVLTIVKEGLKYRQRNGDPVRESEILTLNGLIKDVGFKFPALWDPEFLGSLRTDGATRAAQIVEQEKEAANLRVSEKSKRAQDLEDIKSSFYALAKATNRQNAGLEFERVLNRLFALFGLKPRLSYRITGEQIDGSFELDSEIYLVEAKWEATSLSEAPLLVFRGKIEAKSSFTRGVFIAANGFTPDAIKAITQGKQPNFFLIDGYDLTVVLEGHLDLIHLLREKQRHLAEKGAVFVSAKELMR